MFKIKKDELHKWICIAVIFAVTYLLVNNLGFIFNGFSSIIMVLKPFILGFVVAYILNIPMTMIENLLKKNTKMKDNIIRLISISLSLLIFVLLIVFIAFLLIPELVESIQLLMTNIPGLINKVEMWVLELLDKYPDIQAQIKSTFMKTDTAGNLVSNILNYVVNGAVGFISSLVSSVVSIFMALIFSIYMLSQKEDLITG